MVSSNGLDPSRRIDITCSRRRRQEMKHPAPQQLLPQVAVEAHRSPVNSRRSKKSRKTRAAQTIIYRIIVDRAKRIFQA